VADETNARQDTSLSEAIGTALHREKVVSRMLAITMFVGAAIFTFGGIVGYATDPNAPVWTLVFMLTIALAFLSVGLVKPVLRTTVTDREVYALHGLRAWRVPLDTILSLSVVPATRQALLGSEPVGPMFNGHAAVIEYRDATGAIKKLALATPNAGALVAAIESARGPSRATGVRVQSEIAAKEGNALDELEGNAESDSQSLKSR
jgi:hypothetical protein